MAEIHRDVLPGLFSVEPEKQFRGNGIVAIGKDVGLDHDLVAGGALDRVPAFIDLRSHRLDDYAGWRLLIQA
jgi:hypothetical protein